MVSVFFALLGLSLFVRSFLVRNIARPYSYSFQLTGSACVNTTSMVKGDVLFTLMTLDFVSHPTCLLNEDGTEHLRVVWRQREVSCQSGHRHADPTYPPRTQVSSELV
jgi:hypothetical protein